MDKNDFEKFNLLIKSAHKKNGWFTEDFVRTAIKALAYNLTKKSLTKFVKTFPKHKTSDKSKRVKDIGVIMAGNIPLVGFHDFVSVLMTGNKFTGKLSSEDNQLLPAIAKVLIKAEPVFKDYISFVKDKLNNIDAVIATGSDNTSRYFEYYYRQYPKIIRKSRSSIAILNGKETQEELEELQNDLFLYFGLGCRNVSKIYVPFNYNIKDLLNASKRFKFLTENEKYYNNYRYNKAIFTVIRTKHIDNGYVLLKEDKALVSPISVINYEYYNNKEELNKNLTSSLDKLQCIITNDGYFKNSIPFGKSQYPELTDYADGINTVDFLYNL